MKHNWNFQRGEGGGGGGGGGGGFCGCGIDNRPYSYSQYWTGTSLQWRLLRQIFSNTNDIESCFKNISLHMPPWQTSSSPKLRIRIWSIHGTPQ